MSILSFYALAYVSFSRRNLIFSFSAQIQRNTPIPLQSLSIGNDFCPLCLLHSPKHSICPFLGRTASNTWSKSPRHLQLPDTRQYGECLASSPHSKLILALHTISDYDDDAVFPQRLHCRLEGMGSLARKQSYQVYPCYLPRSDVG